MLKLIKSSKKPTAKMPSAIATFNNKVIAESDTYEFVEGNVYFPPSSVDQSIFTSSELHTVCPWKGTASYNNITVDGKEAKDAAWYYPEPVTERANGLKDYFAFCKSRWYPEIVRCAFLCSLSWGETNGQS